MNSLATHCRGSKANFRAAPARPTLRQPSAGAARLVTVAANNATTGPFAPLVRVTRDIVGQKDFNKFRGKAISTHSQVIKEFCGGIGAGPKQAQAVIRLAKKNGEWLGFLA